MQENFIAIRLILRHGAMGAVVVALFMTIAAAALLWTPLAWFALLPAAFIGALSLLLCKSYVEIVAIVFQMVH